MTLSIENSSIDNLKADLEIIIIKDQNMISNDKILELTNFKAEDATTRLIPEKALLYVGVQKLDNNHLQITAANVAKKLKTFQYKSVKMSASMFLSKEIKAFCEGLLLGFYDFTKYKSEIEPTFLTSITLSYEGLTFKEYETAVNQANIIAKATNFTRDLVNTTAEDITPKVLAQKAEKLAKEENFSYKCMDEKEFLKEKMQAMYMVGRASHNNSKLISICYKPKNPQLKITLVGKGLTYDSGGLSLKPTNSMVNMKCDKAGACAILGVMQAVSKLKLPIEIHSFIGAVENMTGGSAYRPGDVLKAKNGKTIEVKNTDAEGRLVLADTLCFAQEKIVNTDYIFDFATLTGACAVGLGAFTTGVMGHNQQLKDELRSANENSGEFSSSLPFNDHLKDELKSDIADMKNSTTRLGGAITAGLFLDNFIKEENRDKWLHFDMAGTAFTEKPWGVNGYGATGAGVRLAISLFQNLIENKKR